MYKQLYIYSFHLLYVIKQYQYENNKTGLIFYNNFKIQNKYNSYRSIYF